ncbi:MAG: DUF4476 domain-containing protein [Flavobacteriales bacterium]
MLLSQAKLSFSVPDSLGLIISLNNDTINRKAVQEISFYTTLSGKLNIRAIFPHSPRLEFQQVINVKPYTSLSYLLNYSKSAFKFSAAVETPIDPQLFPKYLKATASSSNLTSVKGCFPQSDQMLLESVMKSLEQNTMESRKLEIMKEYAGSQCITVYQLRQLLGKLMQEDNKLELLSAAVSHIYDPGNLSEVLEDFFLERSKTKAASIIQ